MNNSERGEKKLGALHFMPAAVEVTGAIGPFYTQLDVAAPLAGAMRFAGRVGIDQRG